MDQILGRGVAGEGGKECGKFAIAGADQMRAYGKMGAVPCAVSIMRDVRAMSVPLCAVLR